MTKAQRKLNSDWRPHHHPGFTVPRKLKKAWRRLIVKRLREVHPDAKLGQDYTLHWKKGTGWTVTTHGR